MCLSTFLKLRNGSSSKCPGASTERSSLKQQENQGGEEAEETRKKVKKDRDADGQLGEAAAKHGLQGAGWCRTLPNHLTDRTAAYRHA